MELEKKEFRVIIAGTRAFGDYGLLCRTCDRLLAEKRQTHHITVVSGTARGADTLGERYAHERGFAVKRFVPDWERLSTRAGLVRNCEMARNADALVAFWDGISRGTAHMVGEARRRGLAVRVIRYKNQDR